VSVMVNTDSTYSVLFFSRGKGRGHAIPDSSVARILMKMRPDISIQFVSYSLGASTLREQGWPVVDLGLPEDNPLWETTRLIVQLFRQGKPQFVISHEEPCVLPVSKAFGVRAVYLTDWLPKLDSTQMEAICFAESVIFLDDPGYYDVPEALKGNIDYVGPLLQPMNEQRYDKLSARIALGFSADEKLILGLPGGAIQHSETRAPIFDLVQNAFEMLPLYGKRLIWVVGDPDYAPLCQKAAAFPNILIRKPHMGSLATMQAADVIVTKANRITVLESEALGIPSISISHGNNRIDDYRVGRIRSNTAFRARALDVATLSASFLNALNIRDSLVGNADAISGKRATRVGELILERFSSPP